MAQGSGGTQGSAGIMEGARAVMKSGVKAHVELESAVEATKCHPQVQGSWEQGSKQVV